MALDPLLDRKDLEHGKFLDDGAGDIAVRVLDSVGNSLVPTKYDYLSLSYTVDNLTGIVFKIDGSSGTTVSTLTLGYNGNNDLISVTKS